MQQVAIESDEARVAPLADLGEAPLEVGAERLVVGAVPRGVGGTGVGLGADRLQECLPPVASGRADPTPGRAS